MDVYRLKLTLLLIGIGVLVIGLSLVIAIGFIPTTVRPKADLAVKFCMFVGGSLLLISSA